jgi:hypothetical protein
MFKSTPAIWSGRGLGKTASLPYICKIDGRPFGPFGTDDNADEEDDEDDDDDDCADNITDDEEDDDDKDAGGGAGS